MLRHPAARPAFSLTEVLVALFVMAVGVISLLTLFPVGAVQMGYALRDSRARDTAGQADGYLRQWWQTKVLGDEFPAPPPELVTVSFNPVYAGPVPPINALTYGGLPPLPAGPTPSYPVYLDPIGHQARPVGSWPQLALAGTAITPPTPPLNGPAQYGTVIQRRTVTALNNNYVASFRACSLVDDLEFGPNGRPADAAQTGSAAEVVRNGRYNWAAMLQLPSLTNPTVADVKILVFERRAPGIAPADAEACYPNAANNTPVTFQVGSTQLVIPDTLDNLKVRPNGWIMDGTVDHVQGIRNAHFYRIQSVTELGTSTLVELVTPLRPATGSSGVSGIPQYNGRVYVLNNLVEVFDRPPLSPSKYLPQTP